VRLPRQRVRVRKQPIPQLGVLTADRLDALTVSPRYVLAPHPAV